MEEEELKFGMFKSLLERKYLTFLFYYMFHFFGWLVFFIGVENLRRTSQIVDEFEQLTWIIISLLILNESLKWILKGLEKEVSKK
jgi:hypothetical protein